MTAQIKELKTNKVKEKEIMVEYLDDLLKRVKEGEIESLICLVATTDSTCQTEVIGDISCMEAIGMMSTSTLSYQLMSIGDADG